MSDQPNVRIWLSEQERLESSAEGRQRQCRCNLRWQAVPHLKASNRKCSAANSGKVNQRLNELVELVSAGRAKSSATCKVGNVSEQAKVRWCTAVEDLVHQDSSFWPDASRDTQPVKADEATMLLKERSWVNILNYWLMFTCFQGYLTILLSRPTGRQHMN